MHFFLIATWILINLGLVHFKGDFSRDYFTKANIEYFITM
jgi:hypothetical protein